MARGLKEKKMKGRPDCEYCGWGHHFITRSGKVLLSIKKEPLGGLSVKSMEWSKNSRGNYIVYCARLPIPGYFAWVEGISGKWYWGLEVRGDILERGSADSEVEAKIACEESWEGIIVGAIA